MSGVAQISTDSYGVTIIVHQDLYTVQSEYALVQCVALNLQMSRGISMDFTSKHGGIGNLENQSSVV